MDTLPVPVVAWIPIRTPVYEYHERYPAFEQDRNTFTSQLPTAIECAYGNISVKDIAVSHPPVDVYQNLEKRSFLVPLKLVEFISVSTVVTLDVAALTRVNPNKTFEGSELKAFAAYDLRTAIEALLVFTELSQPGCIDTLDGVAVVEDVGMQPFKGKDTFLSIGNPHAEHPTWPPLGRLALVDVVEWLKKTSFFSSSLATTRVERMLAAYTHVVGLT